MAIEQLLVKIKQSPESVEFSDVIDVIESHYVFQPTVFKNGELTNQAGENSGSCKIFSFAQKHGLTEQQTLACFGHYYRSDVLENPDGADHGNIRNFMKTGWQGLQFSAQPLSLKD